MFLNFKMIPLLTLWKAHHLPALVSTSPEYENTEVKDLLLTLLSQDNMQD